MYSNNPEVQQWQKTADDLATQLNEYVLKLDKVEKERDEILQNLRAFGKAEIVSGDSNKRLTPHSPLNINSNVCWIVSSSSRSRKALEKIVELINKYNGE